MQYQTIANEYDCSIGTINYKIDHYSGKSNDFSSQANQKALIEEQLAKIRQLEKQKLKEEALMIMKENINKKKKEKEKNGMLNEQKLAEKQGKKDKIKTYNNDIKVKNQKKSTNINSNTNMNVMDIIDSGENQEKYKGNSLLLTNYIYITLSKFILTLY